MPKIHLFVCRIAFLLALTHLPTQELEGLGFCFEIPGFLPSRVNFCVYFRCLSTHPCLSLWPQGHLREQGCAVCLNPFGICSCPESLSASPWSSWEGSQALELLWNISCCMPGVHSSTVSQTPLKLPSLNTGLQIPSPKLCLFPARDAFGVGFSPLWKSFFFLNFNFLIFPAWNMVMS